MTKMEKPSAFSRRAVLKGAGALVVSIGAPVGLDTVLGINAALRAGRQAAADAGSALVLHRRQCRRHASRPSSARWTWATACSSPSARWWRKSSTCRSRPSRSIMGDTATSVNQGGASGSTGIQFGGKQMRMAAAEARRVLLEMAAEKLGTPADQLIVIDGVVQRGVQPRQEDHLCRTDRRHNTSTSSSTGTSRWATRSMPPARRSRRSRPSTRSSASRSSARTWRRRCSAQEDFCTDIKVPGMVHGRMIRPAVAGSVPVKVDESSIKDIPGAKVVWDKGFLGVVAEQGMGRDQGGARSSRSSGRRSTPPFPDQATLYDHIRKAPVRKRAGRQAERQCRRGVQDRRTRDRGRVRMAVPVACRMGPACALVEIKDGKVDVLDRLAEVALRAARASPRSSACRSTRCASIWQNGPGSLRPQRRRRLRDGLRRCWPRRSASRCGCNTCASRAPAGTRRAPPRSTAPARRSTRSGNVIAYEFISKGFSRIDVNTNGSKPCDTLAGHTLGVALKSGDGFGVPAESYEFANKRMGWETIPPLLDRASPLRSAHLRDPVGPQIHFASESFMDEVAAATDSRSDRVPAEARQGPARRRR